MPRNRRAQAGSSLAAARALALALPGVAEASSYGQPAFKVRGKMLACVPANRSAEPGSLVVAALPAERAALIAGNPGAYYVTEHYAAHPYVLVRLSRVDPDELGKLLAKAHAAALRAPAR